MNENWEYLELNSNSINSTAKFPKVQTRNLRSTIRIRLDELNVKRNKNILNYKIESQFHFKLDI